MSELRLVAFPVAQCGGSVQCGATLEKCDETGARRAAVAAGVRCRHPNCSLWPVDLFPQLAKFDPNARKADGVAGWPLAGPA